MQIIHGIEKKTGHIINLVGIPLESPSHFHTPVLPILTNLELLRRPLKSLVYILMKHLKLGMQMDIWLSDHPDVLALKVLELEPLLGSDL